MCRPPFCVAVLVLVLVSLRCSVLELEIWPKLPTSPSPSPSPFPLFHSNFIYCLYTFILHLINTTFNFIIVEVTKQNPYEDPNVNMSMCTQLKVDNWSMVLNLGPNPIIFFLFQSIPLSSSCHFLRLGFTL